MMNERARLLASFAAALFAVSGLAHVLLAPLYEEGDWRIIVPILGVTDLVVAYAIWRNDPRFKGWARPYAIGSLCVAVPFYGGESRDAYGNLATPMLVAETSFIVACVVLLLLTFTRGFLTSAQEVQRALAADAASPRG